MDLANDDKVDNFAWKIIKLHEGLSRAVFNGRYLLWWWKVLWNSNLPTSIASTHPPVFGLERSSPFSFCLPMGTQSSSLLAYPPLRELSTHPIRLERLNIDRKKAHFSRLADYACDIPPMTSPDPGGQHRRRCWRPSNFAVRVETANEATLPTRKGKKANDGWWGFLRLRDRHHIPKQET